MVREDEVAAAAVEIELLPKVFQRHRRALDVPAWTSLAPGAVPGRLARLRRLPEREVHRVMLALVDLDARARLHVLELPAAELAVAVELFDAVEDVAVVERVGVALVDKRLDHLDDVRHRLAHARVAVGAMYIERVHGVEVHLDVAVRDVFPRRVLRVRRADDLVVDVGEVLDVVHRHALGGEEPADDVPRHKRARVADVRGVVRRDAAAVDADLPLLQRVKLLFAARHRIVDLQHIIAPLVPFRQEPFSRD